MPLSAEVAWTAAAELGKVPRTDGTVMGCALEGRRLAWSEGSEVHSAELERGRWAEKGTWQLPHFVNALAWSEGRLFVSSWQTDVWVLEPGGAARRLHAFGWEGQVSAALAVNGRGEIVAAAGGEAWVFANSAAGNVPNRLDVCLLALSPGGRWLVAARRAGGATIYDVQTGTVHCVLDEPRAKVRRAWFSADGTRVALGCEGMGSDRGFRVYSLPEGALVQQLRAPEEAEVRARLACESGPAVKSPGAGTGGRSRFVSLGGMPWCADVKVTQVVEVGTGRWCVGDAAGNVWFVELTTDPRTANIHLPSRR
jgi:hypothetical protein